MTETWQYTLQSIFQDNIVIPLKNGKWNEFDLMKYFVNNVHVRKRILLWFCNLEHSGICNKKNMQKSEELRQNGNKEFQNKNYSLSIKFYTMSLQYAPLESENLPLTLANRSAALFRLEKYQGCIKDIELALKHNYPKNMVYKLYIRSAQCYMKLHKKDLMEESLFRLHQCLENGNILISNKRDYIEKQIDLLLSEAMHVNDTSEINEFDYKLPEVAFGKNSNFRNASIALNLKFSSDKGRSVFTNRKIKKGQVLFVERPFAFVLLDNEYSDTVCAQCCKWKGDVPTPCNFCSSTMYCTEMCRIEAWTTHHRWECFGNQIGIWDQIGIAHLTVRTFLTSCSTQKKNIFCEVQRLATNIDKISIQDLSTYGISALMMTLYLDKFTNFFKVINIYEVLFEKFDDSELNMHTLLNIPPEKWTKNLTFLYVSGILLRHMLQLICNGHAITKLLSTNNESSRKLVTEYQCRVATAIYPSASMMNHSCNPNIISSFKDEYLIVKATKDIPANSEILNCYGPHYRRMCKKDRQTVLKNQYCFICKCEACVQNTLQNFSYKFETLSCKKCEGPVEMINASSLHCLDCKVIFEVDKKHLKELEETTKLFNSAKIDLKLELFEQSLEKAKQCLEMRKKLLNEHHEAVASTCDLLGEIFAAMGRWLDSIIYLECSIAATEERFGSDSIEVGNEINKITDICIQYLNEETNTCTKQYKNVLKKTRKLLNRAEVIFSFNYGPWNDAYSQINNKREYLVHLSENFNL